MRLLLLPAALAVVVAAGCGGASGPNVKPLVQHGPLGSGANEVWYYAAKGKPRSIILFLHGFGGPTEETPENHVPWLKHLAEKGNDVIYPRYEVGGYPDPYPHIDSAVAHALTKLGEPEAPVVVIGYSRGGRIAVDYAAFLAARQREPRAIICVYPSPARAVERLGPLEYLDSKTTIALMVGDRDTVVAGLGARAILRRLRDVNFPPERIRVIGVKSKGSFQATHFSALDATPAAQAAIWKPIDRLIERQVSGRGRGYPVAAAWWR